ncbi:TetR family transcriptional regulator [Roseovarius mucosus]|uniref:HTH-type transcriptional repressor NicS n=1 Tax=Roseovarius mucosus TaxID=215743 RepID=A0A1V0RP92_9RHOB|nr:TetR/AcrR family transcriptional regulator [Roseovarius mucosus]ARE83604.1 HTH-type transcriptional repressor NicS [Roseovarius mucosus]MBW4973152.1 TetR family transcriptional regulator [Roseovarius mucosus]
MSNRISAVPEVAPRSEGRSASQTKEKILLAAIEEFCEHGYAGASTTNIVRAAGCNIRMLYHYFESKDGLYLAALTRVYQHLRSSEASANFWNLPPKQAIIALTHFTFDYMLRNQSFPRMIINENLNKGRAAVNIADSIRTASAPFIAKIDKLISQGHASGEFPYRPDALNLYLTILGLSFIHITNRFTLTATFGVDMSSPEFLAERKRHVTQAVLALLSSDISA